VFFWKNIVVKMAIYNCQSFYFAHHGSAKYSMWKVRSLIIFFICIAVYSNAQPSNSKGYFISGTIKGIDSGTVRMFADRNTEDIALDSSCIKNGRFVMKGKIGTPQKVRFNISPGNWNFFAFVEDVSITLLIDTAAAHQRYSNGNDSWALIWNIEESGTELAAVNNRFIKETNQDYYASLFSSLHQKLAEAKGDDNATIRIKDEMDSVKNLLLNRQKKWIENFIDLHPESIAGVYLFYEYYNQSRPSLAYLDAVLNKFREAATTCIYYKELSNIAAHLNSRQIGRIAPDFTLFTADSSKFTLSSIRGNYVLIDFWASWCIPCRKEIPAWKKVYQKYKQKNFEIVGVSNDQNWNDWVKALKKEQMPWIQIIDQFNSGRALVAELYEIPSMPFYVLIDKEGEIIFASGEAELMQKKIEEIF
jgi:peroxiredoxin